MDAAITEADIVQAFNRMTAVEMQQSIPGVGQVVAAKLTLFREAESAYTEPLSKSVRQVQGVGVSLASRIEDGVRDYIYYCRVRADTETVRAERRRQAAENRQRQLEEPSTSAGGTARSAGGTAMPTKRGEEIPAA